MYKIKDNIQIISYKHDKELHRIWDNGMLIEEGKDYLVIANEKTQVLESSGKIWFTKEPAVAFFYKKHWFNIIAMIKEDGIHYYCNIATPYVIDDEGVKYIDYDLDLKVLPNGKMKILDKAEFHRNAEKMNYSDDLIKIVECEIDKLVEFATMKKGPFDNEKVIKYYNEFLNYKNN